MARRLHLNAFLYGTGHHQAAWRAPNSSVHRLTDISYYCLLYTSDAADE